MGRQAYIFAAVQTVAFVAGVGFSFCAMGGDAETLSALRKQIGKQLTSVRADLPVGVVLRPDEPTELLQQLCDRGATLRSSSQCRNETGSYYVAAVSRDEGQVLSGDRLVLHVAGGKVRAVGKQHSANSEHDLVRRISQFLQANARAIATASSNANLEKAVGLEMRSVVFDAGQRRLVLRYLAHDGTQSTVDLEELFFD